MAVYTHLGAEVLAELISHYDVGALVSAKGIAEGVSNSNWLIETTGTAGANTRFILTMYERRIDVRELPFFLGLLDHLAAQNCPVPATIHDRSGNAFRQLDGKHVALIEFLPGVSVDEPTPDQARAVGTALAQIHTASESFAACRANDLRPKDWQDLFAQCSNGAMTAIDAALPEAIARYLPDLIHMWPDHLPTATIHADLFPDNVLMLGDRVTGLIDFYFACTDIAAYDLAVTHAAWSFSDDGSRFRADISAALIGGYTAVKPLSPQEADALPILARGAAMRFAATRTFDWINTPDTALVARKDPMAFIRRLHHYDALEHKAFQTHI
ncbi:homoserine kinase [Pontixanthobacter sp.]|uniref:homoserine kinase n=1 Tax=Pontixanthobacter sp. TaxID=2792078 RepID=UPI003C7CD98A